MVYVYLCFTMRINLSYEFFGKSGFQDERQSIWRFAARGAQLYATDRDSSGGGTSDGDWQFLYK